MKGPTIVLGSVFLFRYLAWILFLVDGFLLKGYFLLEIHAFTILNKYCTGKTITTLTLSRVFFFSYFVLRVFIFGVSLAPALTALCTTVA